MKKNLITICLIAGVLAGTSTSCKSLRRAHALGGHHSASHELPALLVRENTPLKLSVDPKQDDDETVYQWRRNGKILEKAANQPTYEVVEAQVEHVGIYDCLITEPKGNGKGIRTHFSQQIDVMVYRKGGARPDMASRKSASPQSPQQIPMSTMTATNGGGTPFIVWGTALPTSLQGAVCPRPYIGYINYRPSDTRWGWSMTTTAPHSGADGTGSTATKVEYICSNGNHTKCSLGSVSTLSTEKPAHSCRFTIYFPPGMTVPTAPYPITLTGFIE